MPFLTSWRKLKTFLFQINWLLMVPCSSLWIAVRCLGYSLTGLENSRLIKQTGYDGGCWLKWILKGLARFMVDTPINSCKPQGLNGTVCFYYVLGCSNRRSLCYFPACRFWVSSLGQCWKQDLELMGFGLSHQTGVNTVSQTRCYMTQVRIRWMPGPTHCHTKEQCMLP